MRPQNLRSHKPLKVSGRLYVSLRGFESPDSTRPPKGLAVIVGKAGRKDTGNRKAPRDSKHIFNAHQAFPQGVFQRIVWIGTTCGFQNTAWEPTPSILSTR